MGISTDAVSRSVVTRDAIANNAVSDGGEGGVTLAARLGTYTASQSDTPPDNTATESFKLRNALLDYTNQYPVGQMYNAIPSQGFEDRTTELSGLTEVFQWKHMGRIFTNGSDFQIALPHNFQDTTAPYPVLPIGGGLQERVWNLFGVGNYGFLGKNNAMDDHVPYLVMNATATQATALAALSATDWQDYNPWDSANDSVRDQMWIRHEWSQVVPILDDTDIAAGGSLQVGAQIRFPLRDKIRPKSFAGFYVSWEYGISTNRKVSVDYVVFADTAEYANSAALDLKQGTLSGGSRAIYNNFWGLKANNEFAANSPPSMTDASADTVITERNFLAQSDYRSFDEVEVSIPVPAGYTSTQAVDPEVKIAFYYAENMEYMTPDQQIAVASLSVGAKYAVAVVGTTTQTDWLAIRGETVGPDEGATNIELNGVYTVKEVGDTDWATFVGASDPTPTVGDAFQAIRAGTPSDGTGVVSVSGTIIGTVFVAAATGTGTGTGNPLTGSYEFFSPFVEYTAP